MVQATNQSDLKHGPHNEVIGSLYEVHALNSSAEKRWGSHLMLSYFFVAIFRAGLENLASFVSERMSKYDANRNDPNVDCLSNLSFWANFGQISMQRCIMYAKENGKNSASIKVTTASAKLLRLEIILA